RGRIMSSPPRPKPLLTNDRVRLYLTLVPYLLERRQVSVDEAAAEFGVTAEAMRSMVERLVLIGLPGEDGFWQARHALSDLNRGLRGREGAMVSTSEGGPRRVPRVRSREAAAPLAGLQITAALTVLAGT